MFEVEFSFRKAVLSHMRCMDLPEHTKDVCGQLSIHNERPTQADWARNPSTREAASIKNRQLRNAAAR